MAESASLLHDMDNPILDPMSILGLAKRVGHPQDIRKQYLQGLTEVSEERLGMVRERVSQSDLDYLLVTEGGSLTSLLAMPFIKMERPFILVIPANKEEAPFFVLPEFEKKYVGGDFVTHTYPEFPAQEGENYSDVLKTNLRKGSKIGVEENTPAMVVKTLTESGYTVNTSRIVDETRVIKKPVELELTLLSASFANEAMEKMIKKIYPGISVIEVYSLAQGIKQEMIKRGAWTTYLTDLMGPAFWKAGAKSAHHVPQLEDRLENGANILLVMTRVHGYYAEKERTVLVNPTDELIKVYQAVEEVRVHAFKALRKDVTGDEIDRMVQDLLSEKGLKDGIKHRTGHFIGLELHDVGEGLAKGGNATLEPGSVFSLEPGVVLPNLPQFGGTTRNSDGSEIIIRDSDTIVMTENGPINLTPGHRGFVLEGDPSLLQRGYQCLLLRLLNLDTA